MEELLHGSKHSSARNKARDTSHASYGAQPVNGLTKDRVVADTRALSPLTQRDTYLKPRAI